MNCEIREIGPIYHVDQGQVNIDDLTDIELINLIKEMTVVMGCFDWGLICELPFNKINNDFFLFDTDNYPDLCPGYIAWADIEIVFIHNDIIYMRKFLDDASLYVGKNITFTSPIIYKNQENEDDNCYLESTFDGFDAIDVKLMFKLDWFKKLFKNSNKHLVVLK